MEKQKSRNILLFARHPGLPFSGSPRFIKLRIRQRYSAMGRHQRPSTCCLSNSATFSTGSSLVASPAWFLPDPLFLFSFHKPSDNPNTTFCMGRRIRVVSRTSPSSLRLSAVLNLHYGTGQKQGVLQKVSNCIVKDGELEGERRHIGRWFTAFYNSGDNLLEYNTLRTQNFQTVKTRFKSLQILINGICQTKSQIVKTRFIDPEILICVIRVRWSPKPSKCASEGLKT